MPLEVKVYLSDIQVSCEAIQTYVRGETLDNYLQNRFLRSAVERELGIIGEAVNQALKLEPNLEQVLSDAKSIVGFRNLLIHNYARLIHSQVWEIVQVYVPKLLEETRAELERLNQEDGV